MLRFFLLFLLIFPYPATAGLYGLAGGGTYGSSSGSIYGQTVSSGETTLNTSNEYGQDCLLMYIFDAGAGTSVKDYSGGSNDATLSGDLWVSEGILIDDSGDTCEVDSPTLGNEWSIFLVFDSAGQSGEGTSVYSTFWSNSGTANELQTGRNASDTQIGIDTDGVTFVVNPATDLWDEAPHTVAVTYDHVADVVKYYVDGALEDTDTQSIGLPTLGSTFGLGNQVGGGYEIGGTISAFYVWEKEIELSDIQSLHNNVYQMFHNPPSRTFTGGGDTDPPEIASVSFDTTSTTVSFTEDVDVSGYDAGDF